MEESDDENKNKRPPSACFRNVGREEWYRNT